MLARSRPGPLEFADLQALLGESYPCGLRGFLVMDFEATCERDDRSWPNEIIEFPAVLLDANSLEVVDEFRAFVRPTERPRLTAFCTELTGIRQADVDGAQPLPAVLRDFITWLGSHGLEQAVLPVTCGNWDLQFMLPVECGRKSLGYPEALWRWCNIKDFFWQATYQRAHGMAEMLKMLSLPLIGRHHSGIDDSRNIARIFQALLCTYGQASRCFANFDGLAASQRGNGGRNGETRADRRWTGSRGLKAGPSGGRSQMTRSEISGDLASCHQVAGPCIAAPAHAATQVGDDLTEDSAGRAKQGKRPRWNKAASAPCNA